MSLSRKSDWKNPITVSEATSRGDIRSLRALLEAGGNPNEAETEEYWPPLLEAAYADHAEAARLLLDAGADMLAPHDGGETPLLMAAQQGSMGVFRLLLKCGCRFDADKDDMPWVFRQAASQGNQEIVHYLLQQGFPVDLADESGETALISAVAGEQVRKSQAEMVEALLRAGANVNHQASDTQTPLMWAADGVGKTAILRLLLNAGAHLNARDDAGYTALSWAIEFGDVEMIEVLLEAGAEVDATMLRRLVERKAHPRLTDAKGRTALSLFENCGHSEVVKLLREIEQEQAELKKTMPPEAQWVLVEAGQEEAEQEEVR